VTLPPGHADAGGWLKVSSTPAREIEAGIHRSKGSKVMRMILVLCATFVFAGASVSADVTDAEIAAVIKGSDDLSMHSAVFLKASKNLVVKGWCSLQDLRIVGGWVRRRTSGRKQHRIYITYCGGSAENNRLYLDVTLGRVFR